MQQPLLKTLVQKRSLACTGILILPYLIFWWIAPFISPKIIGNDYPVFSINCQMELLFSIKTGSFPLFIPGFDGGQTSLALTLGQVFHPLSHLASLIPGYWTGLALEWNTFLRLLSLGVAQLFLFLFLRRIRVRVAIAFIASYIAVYNLRMLDLFRYGASLESWTGMLFLFAAVGFCALAPRRWPSFLAIAGATYWLVSSGHPQMMFYGFMGAACWLAIIPFFIRLIVPEFSVDPRSLARFWGISLAAIATGIFISAMFIVPFYFDFLANNIERTFANGYPWADEGRDFFLGTVNNFFQPFRSDVHGAFAGSSLFLATAILPFAAIKRFRIPGAIWAAWFVCLFAFLHMQGGRLPVHYLVWKYLPFASSMRIAGRITMIIPPFFMLIFVWCAHANPFHLHWRGKTFSVIPLNILCAGALGCFALYAILLPFITMGHTLFCPIAIRKIPAGYAWLPVLTGVATLLCGMFLWVFHGKRLNETLTTALCMLVCMQTSMLLCYGTWICQKQPTPSFNEMAAQKKECLGYRNSPGYGLYDKSVFQHVMRHGLEPFLAKIYRQYVFVNSREDAYLAMERGRSSEQAVVEDKNGNCQIPQGDISTNQSPDSVRLIYSSFNKLVFKITAASQSILGVSHPFSDHWLAMVNNRQARTFRINGYALGIPVQKGRSIVEIRYRSKAAFSGMTITCLTLFLLGIVILFPRKKSVFQTTSGIMLCSSAIVFFLLWHQSLYKGKNLETSYLWTEAKNASPNNIAYSKLSSTSSLEASTPHLYCSGRALDGERRRFSGFLTGLEKSPRWSVDLNRQQPIDSIILYGTWGQPGFNTPPLRIASSPDQRTWDTLLANPPQGSTPLCLRFETPKNARFVMISASGKCRLGIDEVEIYSK